MSDALPLPPSVPSSSATTDARAALRFDWVNSVFLAGVHLMGLAGIFYLIFVKFSWATLLLAVVWNAACSISITGGYHRLFSHRSYEAAWPLKLFYLLFGAASVQNSAIAWSAQHRLHHTHTDSDKDPYNAKRGFWWSHVGWVLFKGNHDQSIARDLFEDPLVRWQQKYYLPIVGVFAFALPVLIASFWGDAWGGLLVACFLRLVVQYHSTFAINSFAHLLGDRPYSEANSARDSWITALLTLGEGYHNFHHRFPADYRNGVRRRDFDPTKWWLFTLSRIGLVRNLRRITTAQIYQAIERTTAATAAAVAEATRTQDTEPA